MAAPAFANTKAGGYGSRLKAGTTARELRRLKFATRVEWRFKKLPALEVRDAAFGGGFDAFLEIFGGAQLGLLDQLVVGGGQHAVGEAGAHGGAGGDEAERRAFGDLGRELHGL